MNELFWETTYRKFLESLEMPSDETIPEEYRRNSIEESEELEHEWETGEKGFGIPVKEWLKLHLEQKRYETTDLYWEIGKQTIDDLLELEDQSFNVVSFSVIPKIKKYPLIQQYNFDYPEHQQKYVKTAFKWLYFVQTNLFDLKDLGTFEKGEMNFFLKNSHKTRLEIVKEIMGTVETDYKHAKEEGIAYELIYTKFGEIRIKGINQRICKPDDTSPAQQLFEFLHKNPNKEITTKDTVGLKITRPFNDLIKDLYLVGEYGKLFVPKKGKNFALLKTKITHEDLKEAGLEYISSEELTKKLRKK